MAHDRQAATRLRVAAAQMDIRLGELDANVERARRLIDDARSAGAELVLLPELWSTGYDLEHAPAHAARNESAVLPALASLAERQGIGIAGSLLLGDSAGRLRNTAIVHVRDGLDIGESA